MAYAWDTYRQFSRGYLLDKPVVVHPKIMLGCGEHLSLSFKNKYDIQYVVNCAFDEYCPLWFRNQNSQNYECIQALDHESVDITLWYPKFERSMDKFIKEDGKVFVHCQKGMNRSAFLLIIYLCLKFKYELKNVVKHIAIIRPCVFSNINFRQQVIDYVEKHKSN
jgi:protein-tyrosine phosphatase